jgi:prepilin-type N-terminal cleavage/methylation domain-containing protein
MKSKGFTLIELLVVIAIIGLLASIVLMTLSRARLRARDAQRIEEVKQLYNAAETYEIDHPGYLPWCGTPGYPGGCDITSFGGTDVLVDSSLDGQFMTFLQPKYMAQLPVDPINVFPYQYFYASGDFPSGSTSTYNFFIGVNLEDPNNPVLSQSFKSGIPGTGSMYIIAEPH